MRTWRVGTVSMGLSLLLLGVYLLVSSFFQIDNVYVLTSWWPVILVILGVEILLYLFLNNKEKPLIKFDLLSIFFVGMLGTIGIAFAIASSTGVLQVVNQMVENERMTFDLPTYEGPIDEKVKRIVLETSGDPITIESTTSREVSLFGTYEATVTNKEKPIEDVSEYLFSETKGDTMYLIMKNLPSGVSGPVDYATSIQATLLVPSDVKLEVIGQGNIVRLKPRLLLSNWKVEDAHDVSIVMGGGENIAVTASNIGELIGNEWIVKEAMAERKSGSYKSGEGTSHISVNDSNVVSLHTN